MSPLNAVVHAENQLRTAKKKLADYGNSSEMLHNENMDLLRQMQQYADKFTMISTQAEDAISLVEVCVNEWKTAIEMLKKLNKSVFHMNSQVHLLARSAGLRTSPEPMDLSAPCHQNAINTSTFELINNAVHEAKARMENEAKRNRFVKSMYTLTIPNMTTETSDVKEILKKMINEHKNMVQSIDEIVEQMDEIN